MSLALNLVSINIPGYGSSEGICLPCLGVSVRASISPCPLRSECKTLQVKILSSKCSLRNVFFACNTSSGGQRRNPDFSRQNRNGFSRNMNRHINGRENSENLDESKFLSTKNGPLLSFSNSPKSQPTASPGPREREVVELFKKVQAKLRERAAIKEEKKIESLKVKNKEGETVDSLLKLLRKHSVEQEKRKVNEDNKSRSFFNSNSLVGEEPKETISPSLSRPPSSFRRRSPVSRVRYEPIVSTEDTTNSVSHEDIEDEKTSETHSEPDPVPEPEFYSEPDMDIYEDKEETELEPQTDVVESHAASELSMSEFTDIKDYFGEDDTEKQHIEVKDLNAMKLTELRALAKAQGMKGFSKLKKSELVGLLCEDSM